MAQNYIKKTQETKKRLKVSGVYRKIFEQEKEKKKIAEEMFEKRAVGPFLKEISPQLKVFNFKRVS